MSDLLQLPVDDFTFINDPSHQEQTGFIAQDLEKVFPGAVTKNGDDGVAALGASSTPWQVDYGRVTPLLAKSIQDLAGITFGTSTNALYMATSTFPDGLAPALASLASSTASTTDAFGHETFLGHVFDRIMAWLGDAGNGIQTIVANVFKAHEVQTDKLCITKSDGTSVCVTGDQLSGLLSGGTKSSATGAGSTSSSGDSTSNTTSTTPVLSVNGNDPATVTVGASYNDLGATITGPQGDLNLGVVASVDGGATTSISSIVIDTSVAGTHTIQYSATDQNGLVGSAQRVVNVVSNSDDSTAATNTADSEDTTTTGDTSSDQNSTTDTSASASAGD